MSDRSIDSNVWMCRNLALHLVLRPFSLYGNGHVSRQNGRDGGHVGCEDDADGSPMMFSPSLGSCNRQRFFSESEDSVSLNRVEVNFC